VRDLLAFWVSDDHFAVLAALGLDVPALTPPGGGRAASSRLLRRLA
jgi:hypothetical protein